MCIISTDQTPYVIGVINNSAGSHQGVSVVRL